MSDGWNPEWGPQRPDTQSLRSAFLDMLNWQPVSEAIVDMSLMCARNGRALTRVRIPRHKFIGFIHCLGSKAWSTEKSDVETGYWFYGLNGPVQVLPMPSEDALPEIETALDVQAMNAALKEFCTPEKIQRLLSPDTPAAVERIMEKVVAAREPDE